MGRRLVGIAGRAGPGRIALRHSNTDNLMLAPRYRYWLLAISIHLGSGEASAIACVRPRVQATIYLAKSFRTPAIKTNFVK
jgi:hypothetical protein